MVSCSAFFPPPFIIFIFERSVSPCLWGEEKKLAQSLHMNGCQIGAGWFGFSGQQWGRSRQSGGSRLAEIKSGNSDERPFGKWIKLWGGMGGAAPSSVSSAPFGSTRAQLIPMSQLDKLSIC